MKFNGELDQPLQTMVRQCDGLLTSPARLDALKRSGLMGTPKDEAFDRLARMAAQILRVPLTIVSLVGDKTQFFKAGFGLPPPFDTVREIPIDSSICRYTLRGDPIIAADTSVDPFLKYHPTTESWGITAFLAIPMITHDGHVLGAFCAVDTKIREWSNDEITIMKELTASVMREIYLREQVSKLQVEQELRERFVATLSHDLRTPLGVAKMGAEILGSDDCDFSERTKISKMISENMTRADQMILDLLDATRIKSGEKVHVDLAPCELNHVVRSTVRNIMSLYPQRLVAVVDGEIHGRWDPKAIGRIVENLVGNAVKYGASETPIKIETSADKTKARISVHNFGNPISPEHLETLFLPYRRLDSATEGSQKGWGIGLTLVRGFAEAHGGAAKVTSSAEEGTTFTVELPCDRH